MRSGPERFGLIDGQWTQSPDQGLMFERLFYCRSYGMCYLAGWLHLFVHTEAYQKQYVIEQPARPLYFLHR